MSTRNLAMVAAVLGGVAAIGVFLPWAYHSLRDAGGVLVGEGTASGTNGPFPGTWVLILAALGTIAAALTADRREDARPAAGRFPLLASILFTLSLAMTLVSLFRDIGAGTDHIGDYALEARKSWGLYLTLTATLAATTTSAAAAMRARRPTADATADAAADAAVTDAAVTDGAANDAAANATAPSPPRA